jgi:hypothetical protein
MLILQQLALPNANITKQPLPTNDPADPQFKVALFILISKVALFLGLNEKRRQTAWTVGLVLCCSRLCGENACFVVLQ